MNTEVLRQALRTSRRTILGWTVGVAVFLVINVATYPAVKGQAQYDDLMQDMPDAMLALFGIEADLSLTSPAGYLISQVFGFLLPMLFVFLAVSVGSRLLASEEEAGTLDLLLALPVSRRRVAVEKFTAMIVVILVVGFASWVTLAVSSPTVGLNAGLGAMAVGVLAAVLFGVQSGALALGVGAAFGRRAPAIAVASVVAIAGFLLESLAEIADVLKPVRWLGPFHFVNGNTPMLHGLRALDVAVLVGLALAAAWAGLWAFERRDLGT